MSASYFGVASLSADQLNQLQSLEKELGLPVLAVKPIATLADLSPDQVERVQALEQKLGVVLLACKSS